MADETEDANEGRTLAMAALMVLLEVADSKTAPLRDRQEARRALDACVLSFEALLADPFLDPAIRHDIEDAVRQFRH